MKFRAVVGVLCVSIATCCVANDARAGEGKSATVDCAKMEELDFSTIRDAPTQLTRTVVHSGERRTTPICELRGYVAPQVGFALYLPVSAWNGKFLEVGCHGYCGRVNLSRHECADPLHRGYACASTDMGHEGTGVDGLWALNNLQSEVDWGYRATHVVAVASKMIVRRYYGRAPVHSYFVGWSTGGRQGLMEAERYPWDFDGIVAGDAPIDWLGAMMTLAWDHSAAVDKDGKLILDDHILAALHAAVLAKCGREDGLNEGFVTEPLKCRFDPAVMRCRGKTTTRCLSAAQLDAVRKIYSGPVDDENRRIYPLGAALPGSEMAWGFWIKNGLVISRNTFRYLAYPPDSASNFEGKLDFDRDYARFDTMEALYGATNPDLRRFKAAGGKLLVWQGWGSIPVPPLVMIDYYRMVQSVMGGRAATQAFFRLFLIPGLGHGNDEGGVDNVDYLTYLEDWVEKGHPPKVMLGIHLKSPPMGLRDWNRVPVDPADVEFTRPLYPYPTQSRYKGRGNPNYASSFEPVQP